MKLLAKIIRHPAGPPIVLIALTLLWRALFLLNGAALLDSDEAVEGIMAQRALRGELLIYFIDQHYMGRLENYLLALWFALTRLETPLGIKIFGMLIGCAFTLSLYGLLQALYRDRAIAFCGALFAAAAPALFTLWTLKIRAFVFILILGQLILWLAVELAAACRTALANAGSNVAQAPSPVRSGDRGQQSAEKAHTPDESLSQCATGGSACATLIALGLLCGLALYQYILVLPYLAIAGLLLLCSPAAGYCFRELRRPAQALAVLALLLLLLPLVYQGVGVLGRPLEQPTYRRLALLLLAFVLMLCALQLYAAARKIPALQFPLGQGLLAFALGFAPAIYHAAVAPDLWYKNAPADWQRLLVTLYVTPLQNLPYLLGSMLSISDLGPQHFRQPSYAAPWFKFCYVVLILSTLVCFIYLTLRPGIPELTRRQRKANLLLLLLIGCAWFFFCLSGPEVSNTRHMLPIYTGLFGVLGFLTAFLYRRNRYAGAVYALLLVGIFGFYNFRHRLADVAWPSYHRPEVVALERLLREHDLNAAYCYDAAICHELQFALGPDYALVPTYQMLRYKDNEPLLARSTRYAVILPENIKDLALPRQVEYGHEKIGKQNCFYGLQLAGKPLTYAEYKQLQGAPPEE